LVLSIYQAYPDPTSSGANVRPSVAFFFLVISSASAVPIGAQTHPPPKISPKIYAAKTVFFDDQTGVPAVGKDALAQLKKWGRFQIVADKSQADLILLLSASPPKGGRVIYSGGQTGTINKSGTIDEDAVPDYHHSAPVRDAYLTLFDAKSGESLWTDSHIWGGLVTGRNSAGARLISRLKREMKK
jgi:hypothetical protein